MVDSLKSGSMLGKKWQKGYFHPVNSLQIQFSLKTKSLRDFLQMQKETCLLKVLWWYKKIVVPNFCKNQKYLFEIQ